MEPAVAVGGKRPVTREIGIYTCLKSSDQADSIHRRRRCLQMRTTVEPEIDQESGEQLEKLYHVIILNDDEHTFDYVIEMLQAVFGLSYAAALASTMEADSTGSAIVWTFMLEEAEKKRDPVHAYGPDWRMPNSKGSVAALVEPAA